MHHTCNFLEVYFFVTLVTYVTNIHDSLFQVSILAWLSTLELRIWFHCSEIYKIWQNRCRVCTSIACRPWKDQLGEIWTIHVCCPSHVHDLLPGCVVMLVHLYHCGCGQLFQQDLLNSCKQWIPFWSVLYQPECLGNIFVNLWYIRSQYHITDKKYLACYLFSDNIFSKHVIKRGNNAFFHMEY